jgi:pimeloyl-ACP methyl ester carboxylesterase
MSTFVLVHGAWHGGWCWHKVVARLEARGHYVAAPDMPGHGIDRAPIEAVTMDTIVAKIGAAIDAAPGPVVLVGHSYGGAVISQTAEQYADRIARLVFVAAYSPRDGQSTSEAAAEGTTDSVLNGNIVFSDDGKTATVAPAALVAGFYAQCAPEDAALARLLLVPEAVAGFQTPMRLTPERFGRIPRIYIECTEDRAISIAKQRELQAAQPFEQVFSLATDHSPFFSTPDALAGLLDGLG